MVNVQHGLWPMMHVGAAFSLTVRTRPITIIWKTQESNEWISCVFFRGKEQEWNAAFGGGKRGLSGGL